MTIIPQLFHDWAASVHGPDYRKTLPPVQLEETEKAFISGLAQSFLFSKQMNCLPPHVATKRMRQFSDEIRFWFAEAGKGKHTSFAPEMPTEAPEVLITPDIEKAPWIDLKRTFEVNGLGNIVRIGRLPNGTTSGKSTVTVAIQVASGETYCGQTTMNLFLAAASALKAREEEMSGSNSRN